MVASHSGRAEWLANDAYEALTEAIRVSSEAVANSTHTDPATAAELAQRWHWVAGLQRQAEIHARIAAAAGEERDEGA